MKKVVTMHDLIFKYFPKDYQPIDRMIYERKFRNACDAADIIVAISEQTKSDLIEYYGVSPSKIEVVYQACDEIFRRQIHDSQVEHVKNKYALPETYFLYVGSIIRRKNLGAIIEAMAHTQAKHRLPLVIIGNGSDYESEVRSIIQRLNLDSFVQWIKPVFSDFPEIYACARGFILPSYHEGFGIPLLEAMTVGTPVITSNQSALSEVIGQAGLTVSPDHIEALQDAMMHIASDDSLVQNLIGKGKTRALDFAPEKLSQQMIDVYTR